MNLEKWLWPYYNNFVKALNSGRLTGSLLISGTYGQGAYSLALYCAKAYLCQHRQNSQPCNNCKSCAMFDSMSHPDFMCVRPVNKSAFDAGEDFSNKYDALLQRQSGEVLRVDSLRKMSSYLYESAATGPCKVCVVSYAHTMTESAANAILKTFEEPPLNTLIIMVADSLELLLPTILSRALKLPIFAIDENEALSYLQNAGIDTSLSKVALSLSSNAPLDAKYLCDIGICQSAIAIVDGVYGLLEHKYSDDYLLDLLSKLDIHTIKIIFNNLILQIIKFKAHVPLDKLPLLDSEKALTFAKIKADRLFEIDSMLNNLDKSNQAMVIRAPKATLRAFLQKLLG